MGTRRSCLPSSEQHSKGRNAKIRSATAMATRVSMRTVLKVDIAPAASPGTPPNPAACNVAAHAGYAPARQASLEQDTEDYAAISGTYTPGWRGSAHQVAAPSTTGDRGMPGDQIRRGGSCLWVQRKGKSHECFCVTLCCTVPCPCGGQCARSSQATSKLCTAACPTKPNGPTSTSASAVYQ